MKKLMPGILLNIAVNMVCAMQPSPDLNSSNNIDSILEKIELIPIMINGDKNNRINIVIMNRWTSGELAPYNTEEMKGEFVKDINESLIAALTPGDERAQTAYANYREFFNVYGKLIHAYSLKNSGSQDVDRQTFKIGDWQPGIYLPRLKGHRQKLKPIIKY